MPSVEANDCIVCGKDPCICVCAKCGVGDHSSYYPVDGGLERESNLTFDSLPMQDDNLDPVLFRAGWRHTEINEHHIRFRIMCRDCLNKLEVARDVWKEIDKERKNLDADAKQPDPFYAQLVGAEKSEGDQDYWKLFNE
jgi:hypothetical protein